MGISLKELKAQTKKMANKEIAGHSQRFFKTGPGEYGEGDRFLGIRVPEIRKLARKFRSLPRAEVLQLLKSRFHEERLLALFILVDHFKKGSDVEKTEIYHAYLNLTKFINNWDLVDSSAHQIVGSFLSDCDRKPLYNLAKSQSLWERRIAIIATYCFIKRDGFSDTLKIAEILLSDKEDLIHKAVGWMLREIGNRDLDTEQEFLLKHYKIMPRTMLRYAIEKFDESKRQAYLRGEI